MFKKRQLWRAGLFGQSLLLIAATTEAFQREVPYEKMDTHAESIQPKKKLSKSDSILQQLIAFDSTVVAKIPAIPMNKQSSAFVKDFIKKNSSWLNLVKQKSDPYFTIIDSVFSLYNLPLELKYLAVIESKLKATALSKVGARGPWQLMPETARALGLKVKGKYDERINYHKSTVAAAMYIRDLHKLFDDWLLVIAAYNSGPGYVYKAIKKSGSRNFWALQQYLPEETRFHVKRYIGAHYYFEGKGSLTTLTKYETTSYNKKMTAFLSEQTKAQQEKIAALNSASVPLALLNEPVNSVNSEELKTSREKK